MNRRPLIIVALALAAVVSLSPLDLLAAGPGILGFRNQARRPAAVRTYRSYSVSPGTAATVVPGVSEPAVVAQPAPAPASAQPRRSTPSYMRADSKARGRFGQ